VSDKGCVVLGVLAFWSFFPMIALVGWALEKLFERAFDAATWLYLEVVSRPLPRAVVRRIHPVSRLPRIARSRPVDECNNRPDLGNFLHSLLRRALARRKH
jgi:hypothetical protein